ncbi:MAG: metallopeptidase family protein [Thermodesulfovibrionales bacterium]|nr:metallopeptidase family protein [Thermodesulfovibrionales bacterium]
MAFRVSRKYFESLIEDVLLRLPSKFLVELNNITIIVEDYPSEEVIRELGINKRDLLGLFVGIPYKEKNSFFSPFSFPDVIYIFQKNIEEISKNEEDLIAQIRETLLHELGHFFGLTEEDLKD